MGVHRFCKIGFTVSNWVSSAACLISGNPYGHFAGDLAEDHYFDL